MSPDSRYHKDMIFKQNSNLVLFFGILASFSFWCLDAVMDVVFFSDADESVLESIFSPSAHELYMRSIVSVLFLFVTFYARALLLKQESISQELEKHKNNLEGLVCMRTEQLEKLASIDDLTQIFNRRKFFEQARYEIIRNERHQHPLSVIMLDIDHFKRINDIHGHQIGDQTLQLLSETISGIIRISDIFGRIGGEEFALVLPETDKLTAEELAERIRHCIENTKFPTIEHITVSLGVTELHVDDNTSSIFSRVDVALYAAKDSGRNKVIAA